MTEPDRAATAMSAGPGMDRRTALKGAGQALALSALPIGGTSAALASSAAAAAPAAQAVPADPTATASLAAYAAASRLDKTPADVRERARKVIFDEMASAYFGRRSPGGALAAKYVAQFGGTGGTRIYGTNLRAPAPYAAMANGTAGHGDEVDGTHVIGGHPGASIVHAATAIGEAQRISGAELMNAVILGYDVGIRMVEACGTKFTVRDRKHLTSDFFYALGATAAASRIIGLDAPRIQHALALVTFQANGLYALYSEEKHISKSFCNGQYAFAGISSAHMAQVGLEGNEDILGSQDGFIDAWGDRGAIGAFTRNLGSDFKIMGANFKFYNAGQPIHTPIEAAMTLVRQNRLPVDQISAITIGMPLNAMKVVDNRDMHNISVQSMVAANLARGGLKLADFPFPEILTDPAYIRLRRAITVSVDPDIQREFPNGRGARVTIVMANGKRHSLRIDNPRGHSLRGEPSWDQLLEKWAGSLPGMNVERAWSLAQRLEGLERAEDLFAAFDGVNQPS
jgi:2-methylcitrate dehydratase PrpD